MQIKNQRQTFIQSAIHHTYSIQFNKLTNVKQKCSKIKQSHQSISGHQWPHTPRRPVMRNCLLLWGSLWHTIYMKHSKCHIRRSRNIQYSNRIVHRQKHPVMVVNAENISRLMDYAWHDVNGHNKMKGHQGKTPSSAIEFRRLFPDSIIVNRG